MSFTQPEIDYVVSQPLARLATVGADGQPDVVPVAFEFDSTGFWPPVERVGIVGPAHHVRITPRVSWSWNLEGEPVGDDWYPSRPTVHGGD